MEAGEGDLSNDIVDLNLRTQWDRSRFYSQRFKLVQERWSHLVSTNKHIRLQMAVKEEIYKRKYNGADDGDDIDDFDPMED